MSDHPGAPERVPPGPDKVVVDLAEPSEDDSDAKADEPSPVREVLDLSPDSGKEASVERGSLIELAMLLLQRSPDDRDVRAGVAVVMSLVVLLSLGGLLKLAVFDHAEPQLVAQYGTSSAAWLTMATAMVTYYFASNRRK